MSSGPGSDDPAPTAPRGRGRPRDRDADHRITLAAAELMLERGYDGTTVDDVAARAGVGKATVYRRWESKEDLAVAAMESLYAQAMPEADTGSVVADLTESYRSVLTFVNTPAGTAFLRSSIAESVRDERIASLFRQSSERREEQSRQTLRRGVERGEVRADFDVDIAVQWLAGLLALRTITHRPLPGPEDAERLVDFTLRGIGAV